MVKNKEEEKEVKTTTISIPKTMADKLKTMIEGTGFNSVSSYVTYILRQVISSIEMDKSRKSKEFSKKEEDEVKDRLRALGYLK